MKVLQELMYIVTKYKRKEVKVLGYGGGRDRFELFYELLAQGKLKTDEEAAQHFFGQDKDGSFIEYRNFRNAFLKRLVNTFFFIDMKKPEFSEAHQALHSCYRNMAAARMLASRGARNAAYEIAEKTFPKALKFELPEIVLDTARLLKEYYTYVEQDLNKVGHYQKAIEESLEQITAIVRAESMYLELVAPYVKYKSSKPWISEKAKAFLLELEPIINRHQIHRLHLLYYMMAKIERASMNDHKGNAEVCRRAIRFFSGRIATPRTVPGMFAHNLVVSLTMLGEYEEAEQVAKMGESFTEEGTHNWFKGLEQQVVLQLHKQDYHAAFHLYEKASSHKRFSHLASIEQQTWKLKEAFIQLLIAAGKISQTADEQKKSSFRPTKFLNEVPAFSKDKRGMNIPVLILHAIFLLYLKRYDDAYDRFLALDKYADRNLKEGDDAFRSYCFIKALLQIQKADFTRTASEEKAADWLGRMSTQPVMLADAPHEVEIMPYEHIWTLAMESLDKK